MDIIRITVDPDQLTGSSQRRRQLSPCQVIISIFSYKRPVFFKMMSFFFVLTWSSDGSLHVSLTEKITGVTTATTIATVLE